MKGYLYHEVNPIVRIEETRLLSKDFFEKLIAADRFEECQELLKTTGYASSAEKEDFRMRFEYYLLQEQTRLLERLYELTPENEIIDIYTLRSTYHNLKLLTKSFYSKQSLDEYWIPDGKYTIETVKSGIINQTSETLTDLILESIREVREYVEEYEDYRGIDIIYDRYFLRNQKETADFLSYEAVSKEVTSFIDLTNIATLLRGIKQGQSESFLNAVLSEYGSISKQRLLSLLHKKSPQDQTAFLLNTPYKEVIYPLLNEKDQTLSPTFIHKFRDDYLSSLLEMSKTQSFGPLPLLSLLNAKEVEGKNLRLVLVAKVNHFRIEQIRERMRKLYV